MIAATASPPLEGARLDPGVIDVVVRRALEEDLGPGDVTTERLIAPDRTARAALLFKADGVVAGLPVAMAAFRALDPRVEVELLAADGDRFDGSAEPVLLANLSGPARAILSSERTALNLLGRLSGIATLTRRYVDAVEGTGVVILDTRKTTAGLRALEKYAVRCGGGTNHRLGLYDAILVKDNHLRLAEGGIAGAVAAAGRSGPALAVEVEAETLDEVAESLAAGVDRILLDNMSPAELRAAVALVAGRCTLEASGGVTLANVRAVADTGVDCISIGALTHSAPSIDVSLEVVL